MKQVTRTREHVYREYNDEKYGRLLRIVDNGIVPVNHSMLRCEQLQWRFNELLINTVKNAADKAATIIELGCGYGYNLFRLIQWFPHAKVIGGEFSPNAREIDRQLFDTLMNSVWDFDFYDEEYNIFEVQPEPIVVITVHAIEQVHNTAHIIKQLSKLPKGTNIYHFEPVYELYDDTWLGQARRKYAEENDYNRDLLSHIPKDRIVEIKPNVCGLNPLNPTSVIHWRPKN